MKIKNQSKKRTIIYASIVGGLSILSLSLFVVSQYFRAWAQATGQTRDQQEVLLQSALAKPRDEITVKEIAYQRDGRDTAQYLYDTYSTLYKYVAFPAFGCSVLALVSFGVCLMHADKVKEKEEQ